MFQFYNLVANLTAKESVELASEIMKDAQEPTNLTPATDSAADSAANSANDSYTAPGRTPHAHKAKRNRLSLIHI